MPTVSKEGQPIAKRIGRLIKKRREMLGISQEMLAQQIGVEQAAFSAWESGRALPRLYHLDKLLRLLNLDDLSWRDLMSGGSDDGSNPLNVKTGETVLSTSLYACHWCGDVKRFKKGIIAPKCSRCGETIWEMV